MQVVLSSLNQLCPPVVQNLTASHNCLNACIQSLLFPLAADAACQLCAVHPEAGRQGAVCVAGHPGECVLGWQCWSGGRGGACVWVLQTGCGGCRHLAGFVLTQQAWLKHAAVAYIPCRVSATVACFFCRTHAFACCARHSLRWHSRKVSLRTQHAGD